MYRKYCEECYCIKKILVILFCKTCENGIARHLKKFHFRQVNVLSGIILWYLFCQYHDQTVCRFRQVTF